MREISCPGCGEVLGVPRELEVGPIRCGVCERIIRPEEQGRPEPRSREANQDNRGSESDRPRDRDADRYERGRFDEERPQRPRRTERAADDFDRPKKKSGCGVWIAILGVVGVLLLGCCGGGGFLLYKFAGDPTWEKFTPPDGRWSAEYPGKPKMEVKPLEGVAGAGNSTHYVGQRMFGQEAYLVGYGDSGPANLGFAPNEMILNGGLDGIAKGPLSVREVSRRNLKMAGADAKEAIFDVNDAKVGKGRMIVRIFVADNRVYTLIAAKMGQGGKDAEHAERFFKSFQITAKP